MKKVLQIPNYYYPHIGGIEQTCQFLCEGLKDDFDVRVVCFSEDKTNKTIELNGVVIFKCGVVSNILRQALSLSYWRVLKNQITWGPDIVHLHYPNPFSALLLLLLLKKDTKLVVHWHSDVINQKKIYPFIKPIETRLLKRANMILTTSPNYRDCSLPLRPYLNKVKVLQSAIDVKALDIQPGDTSIIEEIKQTYHYKPIVFFVGRHIGYKGIEYLLEAEKHIISDCVVVVAGSGPLTESLKDTCHSDRVFFIGKLSDREKRCYYHAASVFAFPSITKNEAFGLTLAEAMYCEAVPVTFTIEGSGVNWVSVKDITCKEVPCFDSISYASAIDSLLADKILFRKLQIQGKQRIEDLFTTDKEVSLLKDYYNQLLGV